jgi:hypothetical protein
VGRIPPSLPISTALLAQPISVKPAHAIFLPGSPPSGPRCLADPTHQSLSFARGNHYAPNRLWCLVPSQTYPLPLLLAVLPVGEIPAMPRAKVLLPRLCELPVASLCLPPHLRTAGKPHYRQGIASSCCVGRSLSSPLNHRDAGANHPATMPVQHLSFLLPCWHRMRPHLASSSLAHTA